jgi:hypothetical protein
MHWIENWFGISPDGGDGSTEMLYLVAATAVIALIAARPIFLRLGRKWFF